MLAEYETDTELQLRKLFDLFNTETTSPLLGYLSPRDRTSEKISRVTFNVAVKPLLPTFVGKSDDETYDILAAYLGACLALLRERGSEISITKPVLFKALLRVFPLVAQRVKDRHGNDYSAEHFDEVLRPAFDRTPNARFKNPGASVQAAGELMKKAIQSGFAF